MELKKKIGLVIFFILSCILLLNTSSYAGTQSWNALDYDVTINLDGSMNVVETWDVYISETNTMFKAFQDSISDDFKITDVKVSRVRNNKETNLKRIYEQQHHVNSDCYYALQINDSTFEIAWNVGLDDNSSARTYKIYYTVKNAVRIYNDCAELQWKFLSEDNSMSGNYVTGRIKLPSPVKNIENLRVWAHGSLLGKINKVSNSQVNFSLNRIYANELLEVRIVTEENIFPACTNRYNENYLETIFEEEVAWADYANKQRELAIEEWENIKKLIVIVIIINIILIIPFGCKLKKYRTLGKELKEEYGYPAMDLKYFRDIPDEYTATPAKAMYLYDFKNNTSYIKSSISKIFSATILDLSLKGLIAFEVVNGNEIRITRTKKNDSTQLQEDEAIIYDLIKDAMLGKDYITPKEFEKYAKNEYQTIYDKLDTLEDVAKRLHENSGNIKQERVFVSKQWKSKASLYMLGCFISIVPLCMGVITPLIGCTVLYMACIKNSDIVSILSQKGEEEKNQWKALKNYMEDYSLLKERLVPDIVLWEKYLVYATAFGISEKVLKQLKLVHPEMFTKSEMMDNHSYWHMINNSSFGFNSFEKFSRDIENVYNEAYSAYSIANSTSSDGYGGGGGFSSGGGGRKRWWKLRWTLKLEIMNKKFE